MNLPEDDEEYLNSKGYRWELLPGTDGACLLIHEYELSIRYSPERTTIMIRIPAQYNIAGLDMFYADPPITFRGTNQYPDRADQFESHCSRRWQRFSRHLNVTPWRPGVDGIASFLGGIVDKELRS